MITEVKGFSAEKINGVTRAFTHFLALANTAENTHRIRKAKTRLITEENYHYGLSPKVDSCGGCISTLLREGHPKDKIYQQLCTQSVEIVLTG